MQRLLGKKIEMTQSFSKDWKQVPVTLVSLKELVVAKKEGKKEETSVFLGFGRKGRANKALICQYKALGYVPAKTVRVTDEAFISLNVRDMVPLIDLLGAKVSVSGTTKGKGFAGVIKRHGFHGANRSHGIKHTERRGGSIGSQTPSKVFKGKKMAGRMGQETVKIKGLEIVYFDNESRVIGVNGPIPGSRNSYVIVDIIKPGQPEKKEKAKEPELEKAEKQPVPTDSGKDKVAEAKTKEAK
jgi:large subunit ribosomal protein L3